MRALPVGLLIMAVCAPVWAETLRVPGEYPSIYAAVQAASVGDTVLVAPGTYDQEGRGIPCPPAVKLISEGGREVTNLVGFDSGGFEFWHMPGVTEPSRLEGFTIDGGGHSITHPCTVQANRLITRWHGSGSWYMTSTMSCAFRENIVDGDADVWFTLFTTESSIHAAWTFERNVILQPHPWITFAMVGGWGTQQLTLRNNTCVNFNGFEVNNTFQWTDIEVVNNIFYGTGGDNGYAILWCDGNPSVTFDVRYNAWWRAYMVGCPPGVGNLFADPIFCDAPHSDFRLHATSPCIGAGEGGTTMGALGIGCGIVAVGETGAGTIHSLRLDVIPNPIVAGGILRVAGERGRPVVVRAWDAAGRLVAEQQGASSTPEIRLDELIWGRGQAQASGVIFFEVRTADGERAVTKAMVVR